MIALMNAQIAISSLTAIIGAVSLGISVHINKLTERYNRPYSNFWGFDPPGEPKYKRHYEWYGVGAPGNDKMDMTPAYAIEAASALSLAFGVIILVGALMNRKKVANSSRYGSYYVVSGITINAVLFFLCLLASIDAWSYTIDPADGQFMKFLPEWKDYMILLFRYDSPFIFSPRTWYCTVAKHASTTAPKWYGHRKLAQQWCVESTVPQVFVLITMVLSVIGFGTFVRTWRVARRAEKNVQMKEAEMAENDEMPPQYVSPPDVYVVRPEKVEKK